MGITCQPPSTCETSNSPQPNLTMSRIMFLLAALTIVAMCMTTMARAQEVVEDVDGEGRTFGHLAKPLKKLTHKLGHYLVHATSDYYPNQYYAVPGHYGGYYGGGGGFGQNGLVGFHRPGYHSGFI